MNTGLTKSTKIYAKNQTLDTEQYTDQALNDVVNPKESVLLMIDVKQCKNIMYPVTFRLYEGSTLEDVLNYAIDTLNKAGELSLACARVPLGTDLHTYEIVTLDIKARYIYMEIN